MVDIVSHETRSKMMARIKGKNSKPEVLIRKALHRKGFRYRLHDKLQPGKPDLLFPKYNAVILINGCFWHGHNCQLFRWPSTNYEFWHNKITGNQNRDKQTSSLLEQSGWRVLTIWECAIKGKYKRPLSEVIEEICNWLLLKQYSTEIKYKITDEIE
ncbi:MAG TPA: very short patch repair endonuclease [Anaerolineaceae bacterium]|nr:very short patch repair endonuclease [Anaerolineaceae bacterium]